MYTLSSLLLLVAPGELRLASARTWRSASDTECKRTGFWFLPHLQEVHAEAIEQQANLSSMPLVKERKGGSVFTVFGHQRSVVVGFAVGDGTRGCEHLKERVRIP